VTYGAGDVCQVTDHDDSTWAFAGLPKGEGVVVVACQPAVEGSAAASGEQMINSE
jgi:hypothetical protein